MNFSDSYILPFVLATALHLLVAVGMMMNWQRDSSIDVTRVEPYYIDVSMVRENPHQAKKQKDAKKAEEKTRQSARAKEREADNRVHIPSKDQEANKEREEPKAEEDKGLELEIADIPALTEEKEDEPQDESAQQNQEARKRMEQDLAMEVRKEQEYRRAITDDEKAMAYVAQIQQEIIHNWSRPPSARNGMEALLRVHLVPTGEVVDVSVEKSSGNAAFDRSAVLAVERAERFQVPQESRQFERNFREFTVLFRPEDLRL